MAEQVYVSRCLEYLYHLEYVFPMCGPAKPVAGCRVRSKQMAEPAAVSPRQGDDLAGGAVQ